MISFAEYVERISLILDRPDLCDDTEAVRHKSLVNLDIDSLDVVLLGSATLELLPRDVELPSELTEAIGETSLGDLYHFVAAVLERTDP